MNPNDLPGAIHEAGDSEMHKIEIVFSIQRSEWKDIRNNAIKIEDFFIDLWIRTPGLDFRATVFLGH